jgi:hypothetical protein
VEVIFLPEISEAAEAAEAQSCDPFPAKIWLNDKRCLQTGEKFGYSLECLSVSTSKFVNAR